MAAHGAFLRCCRPLWLRQGALGTPTVWNYAPAPPALRVLERRRCLGMVPGFRPLALCYAGNAHVIADGLVKLQTWRRSLVQCASELAARVSAFDASGRFQLFVHPGLYGFATAMQPCNVQKHECGFLLGWACRTYYGITNDPPQTGSEHDIDVG